ncbi:MAG: PilZ domain-containing protein [Fimbriimonadia bacterium]|jgi:DNA-binding NtrC family response regulator
MESVRLVLAEKSIALQKVLQAGLERLDFQVTPVRTLSAALAACIEGRVQALVLDEDLVNGASLALDPYITLVMMTDAAPPDTPCLWIRKPFDPALLAAFLQRRCRHQHAQYDRRHHYREQVRSSAVVVAEKTGITTFSELLDLSPDGCSVFCSHGASEGDIVQMLLRVGRCERALRGVVRNARLVVTEDGELRRAIGVEFVE